MLVHHRVTPSSRFASTHLNTWIERGTVRVKCLAQEHNAMTPARARTRTARSGDERTNLEATLHLVISNTGGFIWRSVLKSNYSENKFSEFPNGSRTHDLPEYRLDALTTELWRTHGEQGRKLGSYEWHMSCHTTWERFFIYFTLSKSQFRLSFIHIYHFDRLSLAVWQDMCHS